LRVASRALSGSGRDLEYQTDIVRAIDVLIRDLPDEVHAELARRAAASDMSLRAYLREVLSDHVAVPSMGEWLQRVRDLGPVAASDASGPELVAAARAQDDELLGR
jgi:plasmid stability protein